MQNKHEEKDKKIKLTALRDIKRQKKKKEKEWGALLTKEELVRKMSITPSLSCTSHVAIHFSFIHIFPPF